MDKSSSSTAVQDTPRRTRWDATPMGARDAEPDPKKTQKPSVGAQDKTPARHGMTPSRFS
jgi:hypothetical protein